MNKKHIYTCIIFFIAIFVLGIFATNQYLKSETKYLKDTFKNYGYNFSAKDIYNVLDLDIAQSLSIHSHGNEYTFTLNQILLEYTDEQPVSSVYGQPNTYTSYTTADGGRYAISDAEIVLINQGKLRNRLFQRTVVNCYYFSVETKSELSDVIIKIIKNSNNEFNKVDYFCNPTDIW